jgi:hypothetical protein
MNEGFIVSISFYCKLNSMLLFVCNKLLIPIKFLTRNNTPIASITRFYYFLQMSRRLKLFVALSSLLLLAAVASSQSIYKTPYGKKYHLGSCHMVNNVSERITPQRALELGLEPCKICKPDLNHLRPSTENKAKGQSGSVQCHGITKAGTRCKHNTSIANGYCFQHQPR